jgi:hypothetical protein
MAQSARETHLAAQRRHPLAYWGVAAVIVGSLGLCAIDQRFGFVALMVAMLGGGLIASWAKDASAPLK